MLLSVVTGQDRTPAPDRGLIRDALRHSRRRRTGHDADHRPQSGPQHEPAGSAGTKRLDLQGLRALAVLLVVLNHAKVPFVHGGYIGVDVFFVLSGFLITGILLREGLGRDGGAPGRISITRFYARRVRRILPAACLTIVVTSIAVFVIYDIGRADFLQTEVVLLDALAASLFYSNIRFANTTTDYFAQASTTMPSPFQHFWSLSVEEQFYLAWAPVVAFLFYVSRRLARRRVHASGDGREEHVRQTATRIVGLVIVSTCVLSLAWSIYDTATDPQAAYFSTIARVWELGLGATLALFADRIRVWPVSLRQILGWLGFAMIIAAGLLYSSHTAFPGYAALLPVAGSGLVIVAGMTPTSRGVDRVLAARPLPYIGDRSYTFYLWHYPALILVWEATGRVLPVGVNLLIITGAFMLSIFTYKFYENPLRYARWLHGWRTAAVVPVALATSVAAVLIPIAIFEGSLAAQASASAKVHIPALTPAAGQPQPTSLWRSTPIPAVAAAAKAAKHRAALPKVIVPTIQQLAWERSGGIPKGCAPGFGPGVTSKICRLGDASAKRVVVVLGDSHAGAWVPGLVADGIAQHYTVVPLSKSGCFVTRVYTNLRGFPCGSWYRWALARDKALHPVATIVTFQTTHLEDRPATAVRYLKSVLSQVRNGVFLADPPAHTQQPADCIVKRRANMGTCSTPVSAGYLTLMKQLGRMTASAHHPAIPTLQWFCGSGVCPMVVNSTLTTRDKSHMTREYSTALAPLLDLELKPILARWSR